MSSTRFWWRSVLPLVLVIVSACGGEDESAVPPDSTVDPIDQSMAEAPASDDVADTTPNTATSDVAPAPSTLETTDATAAPDGQACALLDETFLNETFAGRTGTFGDPFQFSSGLPSPSGLSCTWRDATGLSLQATVEDTATAETDDHSGRAYNIDVEPDVEPQDGPGEKAVLLVDSAFDDLGSDGFPYGYFFVQGELAVFIETVGLDVGADGLRKLADEASNRITTT